MATNGDTIWNGNNEILINGTGLVEEGFFFIPFSYPIFVPYPKKDSSYFLIYQYGKRNIQERLINHYRRDSLGNMVIDYVEHTNIYDTTYINQKLVYAEIDINANNGKGEVIKKQQFILTDFNTGPTIAGYCDNNYYWMAIGYKFSYLEHDGTEKSVLLFYKIDENGISTEPIANTHFKKGSFSHLHFSPRGDRLFIDFWTSDHPSSNGIVADFNFLNGELYNYRDLDSAPSNGEFSSNSRFFYGYYGYSKYDNDVLVELRSEIVQYDTRYVENTNKSRTVIADILQEPDIGWAGGFSIAPDGKIYFLYHDILENKEKLGRINKPGIQGKGCDIEFEFDVEVIDNQFNYPAFVRSFFRDKSLDDVTEIDADAGPDKQLCPMSEIEIGTDFTYPGELFQWFPDEYLDNQFVPVPTFSAPAQGNISRIFPKILRVTDGNCWINFDTTLVTVLPKPNKAQIVGSWSLCPYVEEVDYWTHDNYNSLQWFANGGDVVTDNLLDTVKISWWDTNPLAAVKVIATNEFRCVSDTSVFPVRINAELITEPPRGPENLCIAEAKNVAYSITGTNGSVYEWIAEGGDITSGQGTDNVTVKWIRDGLNSIYIKEINETSETECYGESARLEVKVLNDSVDLGISYVTFNLQNNLEIHYQPEKLNTQKHKLIQLSEKLNSGKIDEYNPLLSGLYGYYIYRTNYEESGSEIITLKLTNDCNETFYSNEQQSIVLKGDVNENEQKISLNWNLNRFWRPELLQHEIWYSDDGGNSWQLADKIENQTNFDFEYSSFSLFQYFRVKEINAAENLESWSNTIEIKISDVFQIPDVFTPNGDGYNDVWEIWNIENYKFKDLIVYDKSGNPVYKCSKAFIPWDGKINGKVFQGTYFYKIVIENNTRYGKITILQ